MSGLTNIEALNLNETKITGEGFAYLNKLTPLRALELSDVALTGAGLANLKPWLETFENLIIDGTKISDADLIHLADLKAIKYINLKNTPITDVGLVHIGKLQSLEFFYLNNTKITDEGLMALKDLPNLKRINVTGTLVTNTGLESFKQASASKSIEANISLRLLSSKEKGLQTVKTVSPQPEVQPLPLIGKPIPNMDKIKIDIDQEQTKGKMMLICFFDMEQRPSRNCLMQLSKRAQELKEKDIAVVVIQASKIDKSTLDEWVKEQNIPFVVRMIEAEEEKTRFTWGIKSLPWLILTDKEHIVTAEGYSIGELDERITVLIKK